MTGSSAPWDPRVVVLPRACSAVAQNDPDSSPCPVCVPLYLASFRWLLHCWERRVVADRSEGCLLNPGCQRITSCSSTKPARKTQLQRGKRRAAKRLPTRRTDKCHATPAMTAGRTCLSGLISWPFHVLKAPRYAISPSAEPRPSRRQTILRGDRSSASPLPEQRQGRSACVFAYHTSLSVNREMLPYVGPMCPCDAKTIPFHRFGLRSGCL